MTKRTDSEGRTITMEEAHTFVDLQRLKKSALTKRPLKSKIPAITMDAHTEEKQIAGRMMDRNISARMRKKKQKQDDEDEWQQTPSTTSMSVSSSPSSMSYSLSSSSISFSLSPSSSTSFSFSMESPPASPATLDSCFRQEKQKLKELLAHQLIMKEDYVRRLAELRTKY